MPNPRTRRSSLPPGTPVRRDRLVGETRASNQPGPETTSPTKSRRVYVRGEVIDETNIDVVAEFMIESLLGNDD